VGPESAGANPGPICYDKGGKDITVTDCNLLAGYLGEEGLLGGKMPLKKKEAEIRVKELSEEMNMTFNDTFLGVRKVVNSNMINAMRLILTKYGYDPRDFALAAFGGCGPMHALSIARELGMKKVVIPFLPGAYSAYGILVSDIRLSRSKSILKPFEDFRNNIMKEFDTLKELAIEDLNSHNIKEDEAKFLCSVDLRYKGQSYELNVDFSKDLHKAFNIKHKQIYGFAQPDEPLELVNVRLDVIYERTKVTHSAKSTGNNLPRANRNMTFEKGVYDAKIYFRDDLAAGFKGIGPSVIEEETATTVIPPKIPFNVDRFGVIHLDVV
jgi:N-methylhydantoinase A